MLRWQKAAAWNTLEAAQLQPAWAAPSLLPTAPWETLYPTLLHARVPKSEPAMGTFCPRLVLP